MANNPPAGGIPAPAPAPVPVPVVGVPNVQPVFKPFKFDSYDPTDSWESYIQRFENACHLRNFMGADAASANFRVRLLLEVLGPKVYETISNYFMGNPSAQTYDQLKTALNSLYAKPTHWCSSRVQFRLCRRAPGEKVSDYVTRLKALTAHCEFGAHCNEQLRDQFISGINDEALQKELFQQFRDIGTATFDAFVRVALESEAAMTTVQTMKNLNTGGSNIGKVAGKYDKKSWGKPKAQSKSGTSKGPRKLVHGVDCSMCGGKWHNQATDCPARKVECRACKKVGHFEAVCRNCDPPRAIVEKKDKKVHHVEKDEEGALNDVRMVRSAYDRTVIDVKLNGKKITMDFDTCASKSIINKQLWEKIGSPKLSPTENLRGYTNFQIKPMGETLVKVTVKQKSQRLPVVVIDTDDVSLFGYPWMKAFGIEINGVRIHHVAAPTPVVSPPKSAAKETLSSPNPDSELQQLLDEYSDLFDGKLGHVKGHKATIHLKPDAKPVVFKPRRVPFALQKGIEAELERLQKEGILEKVDATTPIEWASPTVNVVKKTTGAIRICGDYKVTVNPHMIVNPHPLPTFEEIASKLSGGQEFTVLDLKDAYLQLEVEEESSKYLVISTHMGFFSYRRMPFGISAAPSLWQKTMDTVLQGLPRVCNFYDDLLVTGKDRKEHLKNLRAAFQRLREAGLKLSLDKCRFLQAIVQYLGHRIDKEGLHPTEELVEAIKNRPMPSNVSQLRSMLCQINYYSRFIPGLQGLCAPLHRLTQKGVKWEWSDKDTKVVKKINALLTSNQTLVHFDQKLPVILSCDASEYGVGAELAHEFPDGTVRPIAFASRTLNSAEKSYSSIDREALAIIFGIGKFWQYLHGIRFTLFTDHKPLERVFGAASEKSKTAANRLQRWAVLLSGFDYEIRYRSAKENASADALSRLPLATELPTEIEKEIEADMTHLRAVKMEDLPLTEKGLRYQTKRDPFLVKVLEYKRNGWPSKGILPPELHPFFDKREEISIEGDILMWQDRLIIPSVLRRQILDTLHLGHPGIVAMRSLARYYVWWPKIDADVEEYVRTCYSCQEGRHKPQEVPLFSWNIADGPWERIHVDYAGPFENYMWLVVVDSFSKWVEIIPVKSATSASTINALRPLFARYGVCKQLVSDNGTVFTSSEFEKFCGSNGVQHILITPYHPKSNGLAERMVETFKQRMKASSKDEGDIFLRLNRFLLTYRNTPHASSERPPAELFLGRRLPTVLDRMRPDPKRALEKAALKQKAYHDRKAQMREFSIGEPVWVLNEHGPGQRTGVISQRSGPLSYEVHVDGIQKRKHADQLRKRAVRHLAIPFSTARQQTRKWEDR